MATTYVLLHHVDGHVPGEVVTFPDDVDTGRLEALEAVRPASGNEADQVREYGQFDATNTVSLEPSGPTFPVTAADADLPVGEPPLHTGEDLSEQSGPAGASVDATQASATPSTARRRT